MILVRNWLLNTKLLFFIMGLFLGQSPYLLAGSSIITTFAGDHTIQDANSLSMSGSILLGTPSGGAQNIIGQKVLASNITNLTATTTALTVNYTTTYGCAYITVALFGNMGGGLLNYDGSFFVTALPGRSVVLSEVTLGTGGGAMTISANFVARDLLTEIYFSFTGTGSAGHILTSPYLFHQVMGNNISSIE